MPTSIVMKGAMQAYIDAFNAGDAAAVAALFADEATIEDPVGGQIRTGKAVILEFYEQNVARGFKLVLDAPIRGSHGNAAAMAFTATDGVIQVRVIDVMSFDEAGKFTSMRAYFGPEDILT
ncbi:MAG: nuclear transport factor 2 family protein [Proteobacteria bacterium]|nr:nuclear transport factor 2 family protein [Pseudomonadota bacterium]